MGFLVPLWRETVSFNLRHSGQAKHDPESRHYLNWFPALVPSRDLQVIRVFAGKTTKDVRNSVVHNILRLLIVAGVIKNE